MNAHKFVAEKGIEEAKRVLEGAPNWATYFDGYLYSDMSFHSRCVSLEELKQLVDSVEIVERSGGFESVKVAITNYRASGDKVTFSSLEKRLADYELVESYKQEKCEGHLENLEGVQNLGVMIDE